MAELRGNPTQIPARFSRFSFGISHNPLHLGVARGASSLFRGEKFDNYAIASLVRSGEAVECGRDVELFVCLHIVGDDLVRRSMSTLGQVSSTSPGLLTLYSTERFHQHYGICDSEDVFIRLVRAFPLTRVVFGARSARCYDWARDRLFSTELLVSTCQQKVLVRSGDEFLAPVMSSLRGDEAHSLPNYRELVALECEPVRQGIISVNTSVMITQIDDDESGRPGAEGARLPGGGDSLPPATQNGSAPLFPEPLLVSEFACKLYRWGGASTPTCGADIRGEQPPNVLYLRPVILPKLSTHAAATVNHLTPAADQCETELRVGVTKAALIELGAFNGSWVVVFMPREEDERSASGDQEQVPDSREETPTDDDGHQEESQGATDGSRPAGGEGTSAPGPSACLAQVFVVNQGHFGTDSGSSPSDEEAGGGAGASSGREEAEELLPDDEALYLSPRLWFNIQTHPSRLIQPGAVVAIRLARTELEQCDGVLASSKSISRSCQPCLARELHLALVKSPDYPMTSKFDNVIKKYFTDTRIVSLGDVLTLSTRDFPEYTHDISEGVHARCPFVYYKVVKIEPFVDGAVSYMVDTLHTTVFQGAPVSSFVPATIDAYVRSRLEPIWGSPSPAGIWAYADQLEDLIVPYLVPKSQCGRLTPSVLFSGPTGCGKVTAVRSVCRRLNLHCVLANCHDLCADTTASNEAKVKNLMFKGEKVECVHHVYSSCETFTCSPETGMAPAKSVVLSKSDARVAASLREAIQSLSSNDQEYPVIVVATAPSSKSVLTDLHSCFLHHLEMKVPKEGERMELVHALCERVPLATDVDVAYIAKRTAGFVLGDLCALLSHTVRSSTARVISACSVGSKLSLKEERDLCTAGIQVTQVDFEAALNKLQSAHADAIGAPKIPSVSWDDIGGLSEVRAQILDTIQLPLQHPELFSAGLRRSGVLLYGPPGTGKTLLAKAVATECSLNFLSVKGPELINMYVGQSEENVREVFVRARSASPCVIFFDELDSLAPNRGRSGDSGGVMDRVVSQLLAELDGLHKATDVFVIGATNRPDLLDPALLRPGRFDKLLYLGVSRDRLSQLKIIQALTRKFSLSADISLESIAGCCPLTMTGADFYALCSDAMLNAVKRKIAAMQSGECEEDSGVVVEEQDFLSALGTLVPSVSEQELQHYQVLQAQISRGY